MPQFQHYQRSAVVSVIPLPLATNYQPTDGCQGDCGGILWATNPVKKSGIRE
jgi:hypothetical protein